MKIREYLLNRPLLFDGAMGTYIAKRYPENSETCEIYNLSQPAKIYQTHQEYLRAGANAIKTNTFGANPGNYSGDWEQVAQVIYAGVSLAQEAVADAVDSGGIEQAYVFADIGPLTIAEEEDGVAIYTRIVDLFLEKGIKHFLFETLSDDEYIGEVSSYIKEKDPEAFIMVSFGVSPEGFTRDGCFGRSLYQQMQQIHSIDSVGFNCVSGPKHLLELVKKLNMKESTKYISVMPNAGYPTVVANRTFYANNHVYFAQTMEELAREGVAILGGCCGTEPSYISEMAQILKKENIRPKQPRMEQDIDYTEEVKQGDYYSSGAAGRQNVKNDFAAKLSQGGKVIVVELDPPMTPEVDGFMEGAARFKKAGVDAIDIADCPIARARIDSSILACKVMRELKLTAIPHMTCRDRNINATKALLLGLNVEGVNNVLTVTGDPVPAAERQEVKTVFSYNSAMLARHINTLNEATFPKNPFQVCGALNINAVQFDSQLAHARKKIENGVSVLFTQPVMTEQGLINLRRARQELPVKILGGLIPVVSYRNACFMEHEIAGINVDQRIMDLYEGKDRAQGEELAVRIVTEIAKTIQDDVDGFYLITPFNRVGLMERIIANIKEFC